ncbi:MAG: CBS and ACT domain-containing protein [Desulfobacterales bacterium]
MLVKNWMNKNVVTVDVNDSMQNAISLIKEHQIRMLPVLEKGKLVGIITDRDLKKASASDATTLEIHELMYLLAKLKIRKIMTKNPVTVPPDFTLEETAELLLNRKISGIPVLSPEGTVVGTITQSDIFRAFISLSGFGHKGIQFAFQIADQPGSIKEITDVIRAFGARIVSILTSYDNVPEGFRKVYIRLYSINREALDQLKTQLKDRAKMLYAVDHRENKREIFEG